MRVERSVNISDVRRLARKRLPPMAYDFIEGGCDDENGLVESEAALRAYRLIPRYLVDVSQPRSVGIALGDSFAMPFGISPTGAAGMFRRGADKLLALEAAEANIRAVLGEQRFNRRSHTRRSQKRVVSNLWHSRSRDCTGHGAACDHG
jgi:(S)-mandelate dehydrogenase